MRTLLINFTILFGLILLLNFSNTKKYPQEYFQLPVNREVLLSGTFGELRPNHFHAGIDIKSPNGSSGELILSAADGYISRIHVQASSYGNAIYISHPNGFTTVYAHLESFEEEIAKYIKGKQYALKQFEVNLFPDPAQFLLKKGQVIGKMGNTGSSFGAHLHFEIRETATQTPINPFLFGLKVKDRTSPDIYQIAAYGMNDQEEVISTQLINVKKKSTGVYELQSPLEINAWRVAFGVKTYDKMDGGYNKNGIYELKLNVDSVQKYAFKLDAISFDDTRYINAHMDYSLKQAGKGYVHRCFKLKGNKLDIYNLDESNGIIKLFKNQAQKIEIDLTDVNQNSSKVTFLVKRKTEITPPESKIYHHFIKAGNPYEIKNSTCEILFTENAFYENSFLIYKNEPSNEISGHITIGEASIPVHERFQLKLKPKLLPNKNLDKMYISYSEDGKSEESLGGEWMDEFLTSSSRNLGTFSIQIDTVPPEIRPISFSSKMEGRSYMSFKIFDKLATTYPAKGLYYEAAIDGQWALFEYDAKKDLITHSFLKELSKGEHLLKILVRDDRMNETTYERSFTF